MPSGVLTSRQGLAAHEFQRSEARESPGMDFDRAADRLKVGGVAMDQCHPRNQRCGGNHGIEPPSNQAFLPRFNNPMSAPRRGGRIRQNRQKFRADNSNRAVNWPNLPPRPKVLQTRGLNRSEAFSLGIPRKHCVAPNTLQHSNCRDMNWVGRDIPSKPYARCRFWGPA